ncbi:MAG: hypothetical protein HY820_26930 [Acidobacteria bacterium]|nr:hypothetical protein [Acidobacteriota bacterium]
MRLSGISGQQPHHVIQIDWYYVDVPLRRIEGGAPKLLARGGNGNDDGRSGSGSFKFLEYYLPVREW